MRFHCLPINSNVRTRCTAECHTILSQVCPRDMVPTWRHKKMDKLRTWGLSSLCSVGSFFGDIPKEDHEKHSNCRQSIGFPHSSFETLCSFHDSICRPDENAAGSCVVPKIPANVQLWLHPTCHCTCYRWAVVDRFSNSATRFLQARAERHISAVKPSLPILKKLIASNAIIGTNLKTERDSTTFPTCAFSANFNVRV